MSSLKLFWDFSKNDTHWQTWAIKYANKCTDDTRSQFKWSNCIDAYLKWMRIRLAYENHSSQLLWYRIHFDGCTLGGELIGWGLLLLRPFSHTVGRCYWLSRHYWIAGPQIHFGCMIQKAATNNHDLPKSGWMNSDVNRWTEWHTHTDERNEEKREEKKHTPTINEQVKFLSKSQIINRNGFGAWVTK